MHVGSVKIMLYLNLLTPNDNYSGRTAPLTYKRCILYIYSTHIGTEYFKHGIYSVGTAVAQWLRCCTTNRKVAVSIPAGVTGNFH